LSGAPDEFPLTVGDAYAKLSAVSIDGTTTKFIGNMPIVAEGAGSNEVKWISDNGSAYYECLIALAPVADKPNLTKVTVNCGGGGAGSGAAAGMEHNMFRNALIDVVDATLRGQDIASSKGAGSSWPRDGVDGSLKKAAGDALQMEQDMREQIEQGGDAGDARAADMTSAEVLPDYKDEQPPE